MTALAVSAVPTTDRWLPRAESPAKIDGLRPVGRDETERPGKQRGQDRDDEPLEDRQQSSVVTVHARRSAQEDVVSRPTAISTTPLIPPITAPIADPATRRRLPSRQGGTQSSR